MPGSSVHEIIQGGTLEWIAMPSTRGSYQPRDRTCISYLSPGLADGFFTTSATWEALQRWWRLEIATSQITTRGKADKSAQNFVATYWKTKEKAVSKSVVYFRRHREQFFKQCEEGQ